MQLCPLSMRPNRSFMKNSLALSVQNQMMKQALLLMILFFLAKNIWALATDKNQAISISSHQAEILPKKNLGIYSGSVQLIQGSSNLNAETLYIYTNSNHELILAQAEGEPGRPAHFWTMIDEKKSPFMPMLKKSSTISIPKPFNSSVMQKSNKNALLLEPLRYGTI